MLTDFMLYFQVGGPVNATDIIPVWDLTLEKYGDQAIIVYPQSLGDPGTGNEPEEGPGAKYRQVKLRLNCFEYV